MDKVTWLFHSSYMTGPELEKGPCPETPSRAPILAPGPRFPVLFRCGLSSQGTWELLSLTERGDKLSNFVYVHDVIKSLKQLDEVGITVLWVEKLNNCPNRTVESSRGKLETYIRHSELE